VRKAGHRLRRRSEFCQVQSGTGRFCFSRRQCGFVGRFRVDSQRLLRALDEKLLHESSRFFDVLPRFLRLDNVCKLFFGSAKVNPAADFHDWAADEPWLLEHPFEQIFIPEALLVQGQFFETGASEIKHFRRLASRKQRLDLAGGEGVFEKIALGQLRLLLQEKLPCFPAGRSLVPTIKIDFHAPSLSIKF
jgi:hypothetical protein